MRRGVLGVAAALAVLLVAASSATAGAAPMRGFELHPNWWMSPPTGATDSELTQEIEAAHSIGANVMRVPLPWNQLEPAAAGRWNEPLASRVDLIMNTLAANDMKAVAMVINTPCWASVNPQLCTPYNPVFALAPAADPNSFGQAVGRMVDRWGPSMAAVEIWNEPNNSSFFRGTAADYAAMVNATAAALAGRSWNGQLVAGALGMNATPSGIDYLKQLYAAGMTGEDAISIHPYDIYWDATGPHFGDPLQPGSRFAQHIDGVRAVMRAHGDAAMGIWLTEFGASVCPSTPICVDEATQSRWLVGMFAAAERRPFILGSLVYSLRDPQALSPSMDYHFGVLRNDFSERLSAAALRSAFAVPPVATDPTPRMLTVTEAGAGTVNGSPVNIIACGSVCSATVDDGSEFTLTETPASGYTFTGWSSNCTPISTASCVVQIAGDETVTATFSSSSGTATTSSQVVSTGSSTAPAPAPTAAPSQSAPSQSAPKKKNKKKQRKRKRR